MSGRTGTVRRDARDDHRLMKIMDLKPAAKRATLAARRSAAGW
jgi:hypothetical protein